MRRDNVGKQSSKVYAHRAIGNWQHYIFIEFNRFSLPHTRAKTRTQAHPNTFTQTHRPARIYKVASQQCEVYTITKFVWLRTAVSLPLALSRLSPSLPLCLSPLLSVQLYASIIIIVVMRSIRHPYSMYAARSVCVCVWLRARNDPM